MTEKNYKVKITTRGPVHIGSGEVIKKNEYVFTGRHIQILDNKKFFYLLVKENLVEKYEEFIMNSRGGELYQFIKNYKLLGKYENTIRYTMDGSVFDFKTRGKGKTLNNINLTVKDPYNMPYIPGSSLKGALINNLLFNTGLKHQEEFTRKYNEKLKRHRKNDNNLAKDITSDLENKLHLNNGQKNLKIGDLISVSDSKPIGLEKLTIAQKTDYIPSLNPNKDGKTNTINLLRESIRTNTIIEFDLKLKNSELVNIDLITESIENTFDVIDSYPRAKGDLDELEGMHIYLGGGTGFITKTFLYGIIKQNHVINTTADILQDRFRKINRDYDKDLGLAPKTVKEAKTSQDDFEEMGLCEIEFIEK